MKRVLFVVLGVLYLAGAGSASAQNPGPGAARPAGPGGQPPAANGEVRGAVTDAEANTPIAKATIVVRSKRDSSLVSGTVASDAGTFCSPMCCRSISATSRTIRERATPS